MPFTALVTGANKGIGFEIAKLLCHHVKTKLNGDGVVLIGSRSVEKGRQALDVVSKEFPSTAECIQIDVTDASSVKAAAETIKTKYSGLDVLVNNAGFAFKRDSSEPAGEQFSVTFEINYFGVRTCMDTFLPLMKANGRVVTLSSMAGKSTWNASSKEVQDRIRNIKTIHQLDAMASELIELAKSEGDVSAKGYKPTAYGNSKLFVTKLTELYGSQAKDGVLINCACPGWCKSDMAGWDSPPKTAAQGAETPVLLALLPAGATSPQGQYWTEGKNDTYMP